MRVALALAVAAALAGSPGRARAQTPKTDRSFDVQLWQPALGPRPYFTLEGAKVPAHLQLSVQLATSYQRNPFTLGTIQGTNRVESDVEVVRDQVTTELGLALGLMDRFQVGLALPFAVYQNGDDFDASGVPTGQDLSGASLGDIRIEGKYQAPSFGKSQEFTFALVPGLTVPTGDDKKFHGDKSVTGRLKAITEMQLEPVRAAAMLGVLLRKPSTNFAAEVGQQLLYGLAVDYRMIKDVSVIGELFGRSGLKDFGKRYTDANPMEIDAGMRVGLPKMFAITAGGGLGIVRGIGAPKYRAFLALAWSPNFSDKDGDGVYDFDDRCNDAAEDMDGFRDGDGCPDLDNDGDGLLDPQDKCPLVAEDADQYQDEDGCPEADNDGDGIQDINDPCPNAAEDGRGKRPKDGCPSSAEDGDGDGVGDAADRCPDEPEDRDGFDDNDGCPDVDNDNDGIPDNFDTCPTEPEDADGVEDSDGCPDPDNDKDGFNDAQDRCPAQPETLNGNKDDDGCPDPGAELVTLTDNGIELRERINFSGPADKPVLARPAQTLLNLVALVMKGHREIQLLRVEAYADGGASATTQARADAAVAFLVSKGVDAARLKAVGVGPGGNKVDFVIEKRAAPKAPAPTSP
jgi:outer membrane protein OmpA-like peptidoglycan-associated protein